MPQAPLEVIYPMQRNAWDFSPVYDLIHSLQSGSGHTASTQSESLASDTSHEAAVHVNGNVTDGLDDKGLGNFNKLWDFLGVQNEQSSTSVPHFEVSATGTGHDKEAYISDGALLYLPSSKSVRLRNESKASDLSDLQLDVSEERLTKTQRKKRNRKLRKAIETANRASGYQSAPQHGFIESNGSAEDSEGNLYLPFGKHQKKNRNFTSDVAHNGDSGPRYALRSQSRLKEKAILSANNANHPSTNVQNENTAPVTPRLAVSSSGPPAIEEARKKVAAAMQSTPRGITDKPAKATDTSNGSPMKKRPVIESYAAARSQPIITPLKALKSQNLNPPSTEPSKRSLAAFPVIGSNAVTPDTRGRHEVLPLINQTQIDRHWALFLKVLNNFPADHQYLVSPLQLSINRPQPDGIHVFVDASNIMIGFMEHLKRARGISQYAKMPRVDLSFHSLALLLERRRPVAKRVLAGSTPEVAAFEEARQVGYETCILDKVYKAREMTERQKYFDAKERGHGSTSDGFGSAGQSEGSITKQPKWVEQAVDEILHLKICESVIDTPVPAEDVTRSHNSTQAPHQIRPTMVLATGDAAEAEYSPGFLKMVERALNKGWNVEVMAFGKSVSMGYRRMEKLPMDKGGWGERFKIIELDEYAEELFGESI